MAAYRKILLFAFAAISAAACVKDLPPAGSGKTGGPTPYDYRVPSHFLQAKLPADNPLTNEGVLLGRMLFYDPVLSADSTISCASCHKQQFAFTDNNTLSTGINGLKGNRNSMAIFNMAWQSAFFWDGRAHKLREQIPGPIQDHREMGMNLFRLEKKLKTHPRYTKAFGDAFPETGVSAENLTKALEQFMLSILSYRSKFDRFYPNNMSVLNASEKRGLDLFVSSPPAGADCFHCHFTVLLQTNKFANNGLDSVLTDKGLGAITGRSSDFGLFKVPSLRNIELTAPYMHDGRFKSLEEVVDHYSDHMVFSSPNLDPNLAEHDKSAFHLTAQQKADLVAFMKTFTDTTFINDPRYSNPFVK